MYEINVSLNGQHFFATDKRSITNKKALERVYKVFYEKFPHEEGYELLVSQYETVGKFVDMEYMEQDNKED